MPSVHVGIALWVALVCRAFVPRLQVVGWAFFAAIIVGSVHLGWHYAVDGLASILIAGLAWRAAAALTNRQPATIAIDERAYSPAM
jgi:membrane-associated phospholipid phosphatase